MVLRVGTVPFLVARPLTEGLAADPQVRLTFAPPAQLAVGLETGALDVALASAEVCAQVRGPSDPRFRLWEEGPVIASRGAVRSVLLFLRPGLCGPSRIETLAPDPHSRTGRALARILLHEAYAADFAELAADPGADPFQSGADAVQLIGDRALDAVIEQPAWTVVDLGETWHRLTRLPFVYAGWIGREGFDPADAADRLRPAAERGLAARPALIDEGVREHAYDRSFLDRYLNQDVVYHLSVDELRATLQEFGLRLARSGVTSRTASESGNRLAPGG
ncbi:MAG TPA: MqnA/MqnD/SBP family protein [Planctomycetota bacterium]